MYFVAVDIISLFALMYFANFLDRTFSFLIHLFDGFDFGFGVFSRIYLFRSFAYFDFQWISTPPLFLSLTFDFCLLLMNDDNVLLIKHM